MRPSPLAAALDADHNGSVSAAELASAPVALATLDANNDGQITQAEVMPQRREGGEPGSPASGPSLVDTLFGFDENKDGKLSKSEVPERMQGIFARADADGDGLLTREEVTKASAAQQRAGGPGGPGGGRPGGPGFDPIFRALDQDGNQVLSAAEIANSPAALKALDKDGDGTLSEQELRPARGPGGMGGRDPREMINHLFEENDANQDGKLSKAEMPERMQEMFARADANQDGFVTKDELAKAFEGMGQRRQ